MDRFDCVIIGSGPAGFESALGLAKLGNSVAMVEKDDLGGVCLNRGCIPTKVMVSAAKRLERTQSARRYGLEVAAPAFSCPDLMKYRRNVTSRLRKGLEQRIREAGITIYNGTGSMDGPGSVRVSDGGGGTVATLAFHRLVIAAGAKPVVPAAWSGIDGVVDSEGFWELDDLPKDILIVGGGVVGCEYASSLATLGFTVTVVESENRLLTTEEPEVSSLILKQLTSKGVSVFLETTVDAISGSRGSLEVRLGDRTVSCALVVCCMGRKAFPESLGLDRVGLDLSMASSLRLKDSIMIAGDIAPGPQLAHKAAHDAQVITDRAAGKDRSPRYDLIPLAVFTSPEVGRAGMTEREAERIGEVDVRTMNFAEMGKAIADNAPQGFLKIIADRETRKILGMTILGHEASEFSGYASLVLYNEMTVDGLGQVVFSHPTLGEIFRECAGRF